jgi:hypothetical protein
VLERTGGVPLFVGELTRAVQAIPLPHELMRSQNKLPRNATSFVGHLEMQVAFAQIFEIILCIELLAGSSDQQIVEGQQ